MANYVVYPQTILFTMDEEILEAVSRYDGVFESDLLLELEDDIGEDEVERPVTADKGEAEVSQTVLLHSVCSAKNFMEANEQSVREESFYYFYSSPFTLVSIRVSIGISICVGISISAHLMSMIEPKAFHQWLSNLDI